MPYLPCHYLCISFIFHTCWVPTISVLNLVIFPYYSNLLLRRLRWTGILRWWVLGYVLPRLLFLWCYGVFRCPVSLRVILVFRDLIYVIIIHYSWYLVIYEDFWPYEWNNWSWVMHIMSAWFWHKNWVWQTRRVLWKIHSEFFSDCSTPHASSSQRCPVRLHRRVPSTFHTLKKALIFTSVIQPPDRHLPFEIMCDASDYAVGAVFG
jgi:hypothetical protein